MKPYSIDLRQRIVDAVKSGESRTSAARRFNVGYVTVLNYLKLDALGSLEPRTQKSRPCRKFTPAALNALKAWLEEKNDLTLKQLQQRLGERFQVYVSQPAIWGRLMAMNLTWKKNRPAPPNGSAQTSRHIENVGRRKSETRR